VTRPALAVVLAAALTLAAYTPAAAACGEDLVSAGQNIERTRIDLQAAAPAGKCAAYRQHVAALTQVRGVFARCDSGPNKAKNGAQVGASLTDMTRQMRQSCKR